MDEPRNSCLMALLYRTAEWHGLAKLRMHTESTLALLESLTTEFGLLMQQFQELTCSDFATVELQWEKAARELERRKVNNLSSQGSSQRNLDQAPIVIQQAVGSSDSQHCTVAPSTSEPTASSNRKC